MPTICVWMRLIGLSYCRAPSGHKPAKPSGPDSCQARKPPIDEAAMPQATQSGRVLKERYRQRVRGQWERTISANKEDFSRATQAQETGLAGSQRATRATRQPDSQSQAVPSTISLTSKAKMKHAPLFLSKFSKPFHSFPYFVHWFIDSFYNPELIDLYLFFNRSSNL